jgi:hypothetical protein
MTEEPCQLNQVYLSLYDWRSRCAKPGLSKTFTKDIGELSKAFWVSVTEEQGELNQVYLSLCDWRLRCTKPGLSMTLTESIGDLGQTFESLWLKIQMC